MTQTGQTDIFDPQTEAAVARLLVRYAWSIDTKDWRLFRSVFADAVSLTYGPEWGPPLEGLETLTSFVMHIHTPLDGSVHSTTNVLVVAADDASLTVRSAVDALLVRRGAPGGDTLRVVGTYEDEIARRDDTLLIARRSFATLWSEGNPLVVGQGWTPPR
jgi:hypothetical protein